MEEFFFIVFASRGYASISWAFLSIFNREYLENGSRYG